LGGTSGVQVTQVGSFSPTWQLLPADISSIPLLEYRQTTNVILRISLVPNFEIGEVLAPSRRLIAALSSLLDTRKYSQPSATNDLLVTCSTVFPGSDLSIHNRDFLWSSHRLRVHNTAVMTFPTITMRQVETMFPFYTAVDMDLCVLWELPGIARSGQIDLANLLVGVQHGTLNELLQSTSDSKVATREMYAETTRERESLIQTISTSAWNANEDPSRLHLQVDPFQKHDFESRPCIVPVTFIIRNYSFQYSIRFSLNTQHSLPDTGTPQCKYIGLVTHHGIVAPSSHTLVTGRVMVFRPGLYSLPSCELRTDVGYEHDGLWRSVANFIQSGIGREQLDISSTNHPVISSNIGTQALA